MQIVHNYRTGVWVRGNTTITMHGGRVAHHRLLRGYGVQLGTDSTFIFEDGVIEDNIVGVQAVLAGTTFVWNGGAKINNTHVRHLRNFAQ